MTGLPSLELNGLRLAPVEWNRTAQSALSKVALLAGELKKQEFILTAMSEHRSMVVPVATWRASN
jgi:hypothetical protein